MSRICVNEKKGITLIALVMTILILIILSAVTINIVINNSLISNADKAAQDYKAAQDLEIMQMAAIGSIGKNGLDLEQLEDNLHNLGIEDGNINKSDEDWNVEYNGKDYVIDLETGKVFTCENHEVKNWEKIDDTLHKGQCLTCGLEVIEAHIFEGEHVKVDDNTHNIQCTKCDAIKIEPHNFNRYESLDENKHLKMCDICDAMI